MVAVHGMARRGGPHVGNPGSGATVTGNEQRYLPVGLDGDIYVGGNFLNLSSEAQAAADYAASLGRIGMERLRHQAL